MFQCSHRIAVVFRFKRDFVEMKIVDQLKYKYKYKYTAT